MKKSLCPALVLLLAALPISGCATYSKYGKKEVNVLGGLVKVENDAFPRESPLQFRVKSSEFNPDAMLRGGNVSLLWGLIVIADE